MALNWNNLTKEERAEYMRLQMARRVDNSPYLPDGYHDCGVCSTPTSVGNLCDSCLDRLLALSGKLRGKEEGG